MLKKSPLLLAIILLTTGGTTPLDAQATQQPSANALKGSLPSLTCQDTTDSSGFETRGFNSRREKKNLDYTFRYRLEDYDYGVVRWLLVPLHPTSRAKKGDRRLTQGTSCFTFGCKGCDSYNPNLAISYSYNPKSVEGVAVERWKTGFLKRWTHTGTLRNVRDEVDSLALIGLDAQGNRVAYHQDFFSQGARQGGTFFGSLNRLACKASVVGLPIAKGMYVVSGKTLEALDLFNIPYADKASLTLEAFSIYTGVDKNGRVTARFGIRLDGDAADKQKLKDYGVLAFTTVLEELAGREIEQISVTNPVRANNIKNDLLMLEANIYILDWIDAIDAIAETMDENEDVCKIWD
jgi:hypothetical protein